MYFSLSGLKMITTDNQNCDSGCLLIWKIFSYFQVVLQILIKISFVVKVRFFQDIGIRNDAIGNMLAKFPPLLTYSLYKKIRPVVCFLCHGEISWTPSCGLALGIHMNCELLHTGSCNLKTCTLMLFDEYNACIIMVMQVVFLMTKAGVSKQDIAKVIASGPELLGCSIVHKLDHNVKYFLSLGIRLPLLGEMIADFPMLLRYNVELLRPKYRYLRRVMVRPLQDVIEFPR